MQEKGKELGKNDKSKVARTYAKKCARKLKRNYSKGYAGKIARNEVR